MVSLFMLAMIHFSVVSTLGLLSFFRDMSVSRARVPIVVILYQANFWPFFGLSISSTVCGYQEHIHGFYIDFAELAHTVLVYLL